MAEKFLEPQNPLKKIDETTGDVTYVYPLTTDKQVIMENGERLNTILNESILYMGETAEESVAEVINADSVGGYTVPVLMESFIDKIYPVGSTYVTSTNESPASYLGGTWELTDKAFTSFSGAANDLFILNTTNMSSGSMYIVRGGHSIRFHITFKNIAEYNDGALEIGTISLANCGVTGLSCSANIACCNDGGNIIGMCSITHNTGVVTMIDIVGADSVTGETNGYFDIVFPIRYTAMIDSFCDKFYWKRTA